MKSDIDYPKGLPLPLQSSNYRRRGSTFDRSNQSNGMAVQQKGFAYQDTEMGFEIITSDVEGYLFEQWYRDTLKNGNKWFNMKRLTPSGLSLLTCRFIGAYNGPTPVGLSGKFRYSAVIEVMPDD